MGLHDETILFVAFIFLGVVYGIIFDFFRALRKVKKRKDAVVVIQDIVFFIIVGIILSFFLYVYMKEGLRIYLLLSITLGVIIYMSIAGNKVVSIFIVIINGYKNILAFIFLPFDVIRQIFEKQIKFLKNIANKCCKKISYMINFYCHKLLNLRKNHYKRGRKYAKSRNVKTN